MEENGGKPALAGVNPGTVGLGNTFPDNMARLFSVL
jgi:hypothetical protein